MSATSTTSLQHRRALALAAVIAIATAAAGAAPAIAGTPGTPASQYVSGGALAPSHSPLNGGSLAPTAAPTAAPASAREVQLRLVALRYLPPDAVNGRWDDRTTQALTAFQAWQGLDRDGVAGPRTLAALRTAAIPKPTRPTRGRSIETDRVRRRPC
jgi:murein L,D-transpeptidase YcbB/YkuD